MDRLGGIGIHQCSEIVPYYHSLTLLQSYVHPPVLTVHFVLPERVVVVHIPCLLTYLLTYLPGHNTHGCMQKKTITNGLPSHL